MSESKKRTEIPREYNFYEGVKVNHNSEGKCYVTDKDLNLEECRLRISKMKCMVILPMFAARKDELDVRIINLATYIREYESFM